MSLEKEVAKGNMKTYTGTKTLKAVETTKAEYNRYRGWLLPENEDPDEVVYLVEYAADPKSKPNHQDHEGYITMSPKHVFDEAYKPSEHFVDRLKNEVEDLAGKILRLEDGLRNNTIRMSHVDISETQLDVMRAYHKILLMRFKGLAIER